jgi:hypothetical protein
MEVPMETLDGRTFQAIGDAAVDGGLKKQLTMGTILAKAWRVYSAGFASIAVIVVLIWGPLELLTSYMDTFVFGPDEIGKSFRFSRLLQNTIGALATAGVLSAGRAVLAGEQATAGSSLSKGLKAWGRVCLIQWYKGFLLVLGLLLLVIPGIYVLVRLCLAEPIAVCEQLSGRDALRRSFELTQGRFWEIFRLGLTLLVLVLGLGLVYALPAVFFPALDHWLLNAATGLLIQLAVPFGTLCFLCVYHELVHPTGEDLRMTQVFE